MNPIKRAQRRRSRNLAAKRGAPPGTATYTGDITGVPVVVEIIDYDPAGVRELSACDSEALRAYADPSTVTWINLIGIHEVDSVQAIAKAFDVHALWIEDVLNPSSRAKTEMLENRVLVVARMVRIDAGEVHSEQISIVMGKGWVITFQERPGDVWSSLRQRIRLGNGRVRRMGSDYLLHALLDDVVDHYFVALENLEERVDALEALALDPTTQLNLSTIFELKGELADFRRTVWPMRESVSALLRIEEGPMTHAVQPYLRDLYDHVVQVMDILESSRERVVGVYELHLAVTGHRLNDIMKILTLVSTIFIPMTFIAGVYGMNFRYMPELEWPYGYAFAWVLMLGTAAVGGLYVVSRRWLS